jgi:carboxyl-terminal processing protease
MVVMVNGGTASASELVAGALQDHDRALIVGRPSFGKSLLMRGFPMSDGSVIVLVVGRVKTPCGRVVQREYRTISRRDYFRLARADRDTAGRPSCRTDAGRVVYGGGGIYPDVPLDAEPDAPAWASRLTEQAVVLAWVGGYADARGSSLTLDALLRAPSLPNDALADFRAFAAKQGAPVPPGADADAQLQRLLVPAVAAAKWGDAGWYGAEARLDPQIGAAVRSFSRAAVLGR